jgi:hypothetical protein
VRRLRKQFHERGLLLLEGTGGSTYSENIGVEKLVPGAPLGVSLMRGDISLTGIGTLTHREGDRIIAFGHSMLLSGQEVAVPLTTAFVHGVLPSQWSSFKFGSPSKSVGTLTQDRYPAVAGSLGRKCPMIPVTAKVENLTNGKTQTLKVEMIHGRFWSSALLGLTSSYLLLLEGVADTNYVVDYSIDMEFEKHGSLHLEGMETAFWTFGPSAPQMALSSLLNNPFEPMEPKAIDLKFTVIHRRIDARIQRAWFEQLEVQPGKEVKLHIRVNPYKDAPREIIFPIRIPAHLDEGKYEVVVGGGNDWAVQLPTPPAESVKDIFTQLKTRYRPTTAVAVLKLPSVGVGFKGQLYRQLPSSVFGTLVSSSAAGVSTFQDSIHFTHQTSWYLTGATQRLKRNEKATILLDRRRRHRPGRARRDGAVGLDHQDLDDGLRGGFRAGQAREREHPVHRPARPRHGDHALQDGGDQHLGHGLRAGRDCLRRHRQQRSGLPGEARRGREGL